MLRCLDLRNLQTARLCIVQCTNFALLIKRTAVVQNLSNYFSTFAVRVGARSIQNLDTVPVWHAVEAADVIAILFEVFDPMPLKQS